MSCFMLIFSPIIQDQLCAFVQHFKTEACLEKSMKIESKFECKKKEASSKVFKEKC